MSKAPVSEFHQHNTKRVVQKNISLTRAEMDSLRKISAFYGCAYSEMVRTMIRTFDLDRRFK